MLFHFEWMNYITHILFPEKTTTTTTTTTSLGIMIIACLSVECI